MLKTFVNNWRLPSRINYVSARCFIFVQKQNRINNVVLQTVEPKRATECLNRRQLMITFTFEWCHKYFCYRAPPIMLEMQAVFSSTSVSPVDQIRWQLTFVEFEVCFFCIEVTSYFPHFQLGNSIPGSRPISDPGIEYGSIPGLKTARFFAVK